MKALDEENKDEADSLLEKLSDRTFYRNYESSYLSVAKSRYAAAYGSSVDEMENLKDALHHDNYYKYNAQVLPDEFQKIARRRLFALEVEHKRYADAMLSYQSMKEAYGEDFVKPFNKAYRQMTDPVSNEAPCSVPLTLDENGYAFFNLQSTLKPSHQHYKKSNFVAERSISSLDSKTTSTTKSLTVCIPVISKYSGKAMQISTLYSSNDRKPPA